MRILLAGISLAMLALQPGDPATSPVMLGDDAPLYTSVDGQRNGILLSGTRVRVIEKHQGWVKVSVEGWIRDEPSLLPAMPPVPAPAPGPQLARTGSARLTGQIFVTGEDGTTQVGQHSAVRLLGDFDAAREEMDRIRRDCAGHREKLGQDAARLKEEGGRAMRVIENPSEAFDKYDEARRERAAKFREMQQLDERCASEVEASLNSHAVDRALSDSEGRFVFEAAPPGNFHLHALLDADGFRNEWIIEVKLAAGVTTDIDLTNANRTSIEPLPDYR